MRAGAAAPGSLAASEVAEVQSLLKRLGYEVGAVDGKAGAKTRLAVKAFQRDRGLHVSGEIPVAEDGEAVIIQTALFGEK